MKPEKFIHQMSATAETVQSLVVGVSDDQARWKPNKETWSLLEVVNHLYEEEQEDFRVRLEIILFYPGRPWPKIDSQGWVLERNYNQRDLKQSIQGYLAERQKSLKWLQDLESPEWDKEVLAPWGKPISAGDMFAAWVAHDILHLRQMVELRWEYTVEFLDPYKVNYAGEW